jgi:hypothetical protein
MRQRYRQRPPSGNKTDFAADGLAGFDVPVANGFSLGGRYQYLWINSGNTTTDAGVTAVEGKFQSQRHYRPSHFQILTFNHNDSAPDAARSGAFFCPM